MLDASRKLGPFVGAAVGKASGCTYKRGLFVAQGFAELQVVVCSFQKL